jgi:hypothetical protein
MDHPRTYQAMANLAATFYDLDQLSEAKGLRVQVHKVHLGTEHPRMTRVENLLCTLIKLGEVSEELFAQVKELDGAIARTHHQHQATGGSYP